MDEEQIKEASWAVQSVSGASAYLHSVNYSHQKFKEELDKAVEYIKKKA
jgi:hypothetical protein